MRPGPGGTRVGVVGLGHLGRHHARFYQTLEDVTLVGLADHHPGRASEVADRLGTRAFAEYRDLLDQVDAVSIVVPARHHYYVARPFLEAGVHALVEKPLATTLDEADDLIALARAKGLVLHVGHLERFNGAVRLLDASLPAGSTDGARPWLMECRRLAPFSGRGTDVDVVVDTMIHDLDLVLHFMSAGIREIHAVGSALVTPQLDVVNARLTCADGSVATLAASRVAEGSERVLRLYTASSAWAVDYGSQELTVIRNGQGASRAEQLPVVKTEPLRAELGAFLEAVAAGRPPEDHAGQRGAQTRRPLSPPADGQTARAALALALEISAIARRGR